MLFVGFALGYIVQERHPAGGTVRAEFRLPDAFEPAHVTVIADDAPFVMPFRERSGRLLDRGAHPRKVIGEYTRPQGVEVEVRSVVRDFPQTRGARGRKLEFVRAVRPAQVVQDDPRDIVDNFAIQTAFVRNRRPVSAPLGRTGFRSDSFQTGVPWRLHNGYLFVTAAGANNPPARAGPREPAATAWRGASSLSD